MKKFLLTLTLTLTLTFFASPSLLLAEDTQTTDPYKAFYHANTLYEKGEYQKAIDQYLAIVNHGLEGGNLYYNIGNAFMKSGKIGYAILYYEKAKRYMPGDGDLKSNLDYARSLLVENKTIEPNAKRYILALLEKPLRDFNLTALLITVVISYIVFLGALFMFIALPSWRRKTVIFVFIVGILFLVILAEFWIRYYDEVLCTHGIVLQKEVAAKYEPIDKATVFFKLYDGQEVRILKTRLEWRQVERADGKVAWVEKDAIQEI